MNLYIKNKLIIFVLFVLLVSCSTNKAAQANDVLEAATIGKPINSNGIVFTGIEVNDFDQIFNWADKSLKLLRPNCRGLGIL